MSKDRPASTTPKSSARKDRFLKAAAQCHEMQGTGSCLAIENDTEARIYQSLFRPEDCDELMWGKLWSDGKHTPDDNEYWAQISNCRVLALCFMAAMVEAGDA